MHLFKIARLSFMGIMLSLALSPLFPVMGADIAQNAIQKPEITLINPLRATADIESITIQGKNWGPYDNRHNVRVWFVNPENTKETHELTVYRNYRDCSFVNTENAIRGGCALESDGLFLEVHLPDEIHLLPPKNYVIYVLADNGMEAISSFELIQTPNLRDSEKPTLLLSPTSGPLFTYVVLSGGGFPKRTSALIRLDGAKIGTTLFTDQNGEFTNVSIIIPSSIEKNKKTIQITPGKHTIEVDAGGKNFTQEVFIVGESSQEDKDALEKAKKEKEEQQKKDAEEMKQKEKELKDAIDRDAKNKKELAQIEKAKKDLEKQQQEKEKQLEKTKDDTKKEKLQNDLDKIDTKNGSLQDKKDQLNEERQKIEKVKKETKDICFKNIPRYHQSACTKKKKTPPPPEMFGKPCQPNLPITFQPGCVAPKAPEPEKIYSGKPCDSQLPLVWQEGCIQQPKNEPLPESYGKPCKEGIAITFQPGCVAPQPKESEKLYAGKPCNPEFPRVWQESCIDQKKPDQQQTTTQNTQSSPSTLPQKCNSQIPHFSQPNCTE